MQHLQVEAPPAPATAAAAAPTQRTARRAWGKRSVALAVGAVVVLVGSVLLLAYLAAGRSGSEDGSDEDQDGDEAGPRFVWVAGVTNIDGDVINHPRKFEWIRSDDAGDSLFRSIARGASPQKDSAEESKRLRAEVVQHLTHDRDAFSSFIGMEEKEQQDAHLQRMSQENSPGGPLEISAASQVIKRPIEVWRYSTDSKLRFGVRYPGPDGDDEEGAGEVVHLLNDDQRDHYDLLQEVTSPKS